MIRPPAIFTCPFQISFLATKTLAEPRLLIYKIIKYLQNDLRREQSLRQLNIKISNKKNSSSKNNNIEKDKQMTSTCVTPCSTCSSPNFYSCLACSDPSQSLTGSLCLTSPTFYFQIVTTCLIFLLIIPVLIRKRCLTLVKIIDFIQLSAYFKLIPAYSPNRHIWLYLGMRAWTPWTQGWSIISGDQAPPIWTNEEGVINKAIRIGATWGFFIIAAIVIGTLKVALDQREMTFEKFMRKNIGNFLAFAFYFTLQDIAFVIAVPILNPDFSSTLAIVGFALAIFFALLSIVLITWSFCVINFQNSQQKYYHYKYFFLFSADYDIFPTYSLLDLPKTSKQIKRYSNIRIIDMIKKISFSFLLISSLSSPPSSASDILFPILAFLSFFQLVWLLICPYNIKKQFLQFILSILSFALVVYLLFAPWYLDQDIVHTAIVLSLFGLALLSILIQLCFDMYKIVPVDLYNTGLKVVIEDHRLLKEIAMRRKQQEDMERRLREMQEQNQRLKKQMEQKNKKQPDSQQQIPTKNNIREDSEISLANNELLKTKTEFHNPQNPGPGPGPAPPQNQNQNNDNDPYERASMNSQDIADLYKVDELKRRKVYQWNKQQPFVYSNKME